jgi:3-methyl-2-oxobutanoate hydroxymethyltransferase
MNTKRLTVKDIFDLKGKRQFTEVYCRTPREAIACEAAGIDMVITSERTPDVKSFRAAIPNTFFTIGLSYGDHVNSDDAVRAGFDALRNGADAVYVGYSFEVVERMTKEGIPCVGHVGFIPYKATWFGGFKAVGKTAVDALAVYERTKAYENAGAIGVEMELVPDRVAAEITRRTKILCLSMGSGSRCDGQYLFATDILGDNTGHIPRHAKVYRNFKAEYDRLHDESIAAFREFKTDTDSGVYPAAGNTIAVKDDEFAAFLKSLPKEKQIKKPGRAGKS